MPADGVIIAAARERYGISRYQFPADADVYREYGPTWTGEDVTGAEVEAFERITGRRIWLSVDAEEWADPFL